MLVCVGIISSLRVSEKSDITPKKYTIVVQVL